MSDEENDIDLIESYLKGELSGDALQQFEQRRSSDPAFDIEVSEYSLIMREIRASGERKFMQTLGDWEMEAVAKDASRKVMPMWRTLSIAATVALLAVAGIYIAIRSLPSGSDEELFRQYFQPYEDVISARSDEKGALETGMRLYAGRQYAEAIPYLLKAKEEAPGEPSVQCYLGIAYLARHDARSARKVLEPLARSEPGLYREVGQWNLALTYLLLQETALAREQLVEIVKDSGHIYASRAEALLKDL